MHTMEKVRWIVWVHIMENVRWTVLEHIPWEKPDLTFWECIPWKKMNCLGTHHGKKKSGGLSRNTYHGGKKNNQMELSGNAYNEKVRWIVWEHITGKVRWTVWEHNILEKSQLTISHYSNQLKQMVYHYNITIQNAITHYYEQW